MTMMKDAIYIYIRERERERESKWKPVAKRAQRAGSRVARADRGAMGSPPRRPRSTLRTACRAGS